MQCDIKRNNTFLSHNFFANLFQMNQEIQTEKYYCPNCLNFLVQGLMQSILCYICILLRYLFNRTV